MSPMSPPRRHMDDWSVSHEDGNNPKAFRVIMASSKYLQRLTSFIGTCAKSKDFHQFAGKHTRNLYFVTRMCRSQIRPISATEGHVKVEFEVIPAMLNPAGTLHGGCTATLVDMFTTQACMASPRGLPGVSVDMHITLARLRRSSSQADLINKATDKIIATGLHTKAFPRAKTAEKKS
ncbi:unnamed protein product [Cylicostephanus goldi]|uniref:Thioesterase domain-containing protein n=1 Tax=Cylicostephanus goldi TaxID=71465 RepID=A0A3P7LZY0_CYLGO|nr:unnamed protein product [Cylicostephanus goldi]